MQTKKNGRVSGRATAPAPLARTARESPEVGCVLLFFCATASRMKFPMRHLIILLTTEERIPTFSKLQFVLAYCHDVERLVA